MKNLKLTLILLLCCTSIYSNEICNNGIDDDGDNLIDLNDPDCECQILTTTGPVLNNNSGFETYNQCPTLHSQMNYVQDWIQSGGTSDYYNDCGYTQMHWLNLPDTGSHSGNGYVGVYNRTMRTGTFAGAYKEYVAMCLSSPLLAGKTYEISLNIGFGTKKPSASPNYLSSTHMPVGIYGAFNCSDIPLTVEDCPTNASPNFEELISQTVYGKNKWKKFSFTFTPSNNIAAIVIGTDCSENAIPPGYSDIFPPVEYYYFDGPEIAEQILLPVPESNIEMKGEYCRNSLKLATNTSTTNTIQWYKDGIALVGKTSTTLSIDTNKSHYGKYQCVITNSHANCNVSNAITIDTNIIAYCPQIVIEKPLKNDTILVYVPNCFTNDNNNINDAFTPIVSLKNYSSVTYSFQIFNRWGELVFESQDPLNTTWNGFHKNKKCPSGIYSWKLFIKDENKVKPTLKFGHLSLIK